MYTNYRPISLISNIVKIFEKLIHTQIVEFLTKSKFLSSKQYGFRKGIGTHDAIAYVTEYICSSIEEDKCTIGAFLRFL